MYFMYIIFISDCHLNLHFDYHLSDFPVSCLDLSKCKPYGILLSSRTASYLQLSSFMQDFIVISEIASI